MTDSENTNETESTTDADSKKLENNEKNLELNELESSENAENEPILETDDSEAEIVRITLIIMNKVAVRAVSLERRLAEPLADIMPPKPPPPPRPSPSLSDP